MPRQLRQFEIGGIYHIINRGVDKRKIFLKNQDYSRFILGLYFFNDAYPKYNIWENLQYNKQTISTLVGSDPTSVEDKRDKIVEFLVFVLMPNHYHLIIKEIKEGGISLFMNKMGGYSTYFNKQNNRVGPLFQGRYKAVTIESDRQLMTVFNYVHTNPVELVESEWKDLKIKNKKNARNFLYTYRWSSFHDYIGQSRFPQATQRDFYLDYFGGEKGCRTSVEDWINFKAENAKLDM